jgi:hypothetical protein
MDGAFAARVNGSGTIAGVAVSTGDSGGYFLVQYPNLLEDNP